MKITLCCIVLGVSIKELLWQHRHAKFTRLYFFANCIHEVIKWYEQLVISHLLICFNARVPRSLLPGARSSRLRDRLKEERELSVKKAFIQDMLKENSILSALLGKDSTYNVVIWNADLLPCASKESQLPNSVATIAEENVLHTHSEDKSNAIGNDLLKEMSLYMESLNDLYVDDDDDLSCDFQVDSGTLACVACGILGFPFMCVVQPSGRASIELLQGDHPLVQEGSRVENFDSYHSSAACDGSIKCSVPGIGLTYLSVASLLSSVGPFAFLVLTYSSCN